MRRHSPSSDVGDPHTWKLPHHFPTAHSHEEQPQIPDPSVFTSLSLPSDASATPPSEGDLATHLCLLECFYVFKQDALRSKHLDEVFRNFLRGEETAACKTEKGSLPPGYSGELNDTDLYNSHKWRLIVKLAVARFELWWEKIGGILVHAAAYTTPRQSGDKICLSRDYMPPLDVLMVWHSYTLDPTVPGAEKASFLHLPWKAIHDSIDRETFSYNLTKSAQTLFRTQVQQSPDLLTYIASPPPYSTERKPEPSNALVDVIIEQENLTQRAHDLLWIRSPALHSSLTRCLQQYEECVLHLAQSVMDVPADRPFGIALAWTTHRLHPRSFSRYVEKCKDTKNPKRAAKSPETAPPSSSPPCLCWAHELLRSNPSPDSKQLQSMKEELGFYTAVERARRLGKRLPAQRKVKEKKKDTWVEKFGLDYYEEVTPAVYDKHGKCIREEKKKVKREKAYTSGFNSTMFV